MKKTIDLNKKVIIILVIINLLIIGISYSYALFETTITKKDFLKIQLGNTDIETTIENYSDNLITLASGESKTLNVTLSNITEYDILYQIYYTVESGTGTIITTELTDASKGTMNNTKTLAITIQNNNSSDITIKVATKGALVNSSITLESNEYEFITDTTPPTVTVSAVDNNTTSPKFKITSNEDGMYCVNTSSTVTDISNCVFSGNITANTPITTGVFTTATTYYVHVKDSGGNIGISSKVAISTNYIASTFASKKYGTGGLVAVNTDGTLYDGTGTIREYRYSGSTVNNYIKFNNGEMWRIIGLFKNSSGKWNLKLMRNTMLTSAELPTTYTYNGTSFTIENGTTGYAYWNSTKTATNYNDWTTAGLQYYLNGIDGYFGTLSSGAKNLIDTGYTYYLGKHSSNLMTVGAYTDERNTSNIWSGNKATWNKATYSNANGIVLLYPSDYGYSASSTYWDSRLLYDYSVGADDTSWMFKTANHSNNLGEWFLSPYFEANSYVAYWQSIGSVSGKSATNYSDVRPVLNLLSTAPIDANHTGSSSDPYVVIE